jgi:hypothetical protein
MSDGERVVRPGFDHQGVSGAEPITDPGNGARYRAWQCTARRASVPLGELHLTV